MFMCGNTVTDKLRDKKRNYKIDEEAYGHPRHEPYKRDKANDRHNYLNHDDDLGEWPGDDDVPF